MNIVIWDIESSSSSTDFGSIIEIGGIVVDENLVEKERFNLRIKRGSGLNPKPNLFRENKITIARVKTILSEMKNGK